MRYIQYLTEVILAWIQMKEGKNMDYLKIG